MTLYQHNTHTSRTQEVGLFLCVRETVSPTHRWMPGTVPPSLQTKTLKLVKYLWFCVVIALLLFLHYFIFYSKLSQNLVTWWNYQSFTQWGSEQVNFRKRQKNVHSWDTFKTSNFIVQSLCQTEMPPFYTGSAKNNCAFKVGLHI